MKYLFLLAALCFGCSGCGSARPWDLPKVEHYDTRNLAAIVFDTAAAIELMSMLDGALRDRAEDARCLLGSIANDTLRVIYAVRPRIYERTDSTVTYACRTRNLIGKAHVHLIRDPQYFSPSPSRQDIMEFYGDSETLIRLVVSPSQRGTVIVVFAMRDGRSGYAEWSPDEWR